MLRGLVAAAALCLSAPAWGSLPNSCFTDEGCLIEPRNNPGYFNFEAGGDGDTVILHFRLESDDHGATFNVGGPDQFETRVSKRTETSFIQDVFSDPFPYVSKTIISPLYTRLIFRGDARGFFDCENPGPIGEICGIRHTAIWNDVGFNVYASTPSVRLRITRQFFAATPEPANWALMIAGFGMVGATARRSRRLATN